MNAVISEDSDLLVFGCKRVLYKMTRDGTGKQVCLRDLGANADASFVDWDHKMFQQMVLSLGRSNPRLFCIQTLAVFRQS